MKNKKILIILIIVVAILVLAIGGVAFAYVATDFLKTDEQLFYKYLGKVGENVENLFNSDTLTNYTNKLETTPYENNGKLSVNVNLPSMMEQVQGVGSDKINNVNISFSGKTDKANKRTEQNIKINYSDEVSFPIEYKSTDNLYGIKSELIVNQYIAIRNQELQELLQKLGMSDINANKILDLIGNTQIGVNSDINIEELKKELTDYITIIKDSIPVENISKVDDNNFALTLSERETMEILCKVMEKLKDSSICSEDTKVEITEMLQNYKPENYSTSEMLKIIVNKTGKITVTEIKSNATLSIETTETNLVMTMIVDEQTITANIEKTDNTNNVEYKMTFASISNDGQEARVYLNIVYSDLNSQMAKENYIFGMTLAQEGETIQYQYTLNTTKTFSNNINITSLANDNPVILNDLDASYINTLMNALKTKASSVNSNQMQQLGLTESQNPLIYATPIGYLLVQMRSLVYNTTSDYNNMANQEQELLNEMMNNIDNSLDQM